MKRFFAWLRALFHRTMDNLEDPEVMLDQARRDMQSALVQNREKAVQAITQKNRLQQMLEENQKKSAQLENQAAMALKAGNRELALNLLREKASNDSTLETLKSSHAQAVETVEQVKVAIKRQEEEVRRKAAEALALKAQWKQSQIQTGITKALEGLTFENQYEGSFAAARERINEKQAEAAARQEMLGGSIQGKIMALEDQAMDHAAEAELRKLEEKLGMVEQPAATEVPATSSDVEAELEALEKRLQQGQSGN
ncbi:MAG: PspA/IM30 family protein [Fimbriimonadaceae bacterium]|nr:PspA/IM30 family protein [Fimbriimonadaceae bacterium]QYK56113.1 MAG: PspA/IM30 family protein [Fimbriimonadaceae bacterium]